MIKKKIRIKSSEINLYIHGKLKKKKEYLQKNKIRPLPYTMYKI